jgi:dTDP-glucose pyrophosphorylase
MKTLLLLAGSSKEFEEQNYHYPKYLIEVDGKPLVQHVMESLSTLPESKYLFIIRKVEADRFHFDNILKLLVPDAEVIIVEGLTKGAACTALYAIEYIDNNESLLIVNGDQIVQANLSEAIRSFQTKDLDGGIITFDSVHPRWSYVRLNDEGFVVETAEKRPISRNATAGLYYFKYGKEFVESAMNMISKDAQVSGFYYVCPAYNEMILKQLKIRTFEIKRDQYFSFATPQGVEQYSQYLNSRKVRIAEDNND